MRGVRDCREPPTRDCAQGQHPTSEVDLAVTADLNLMNRSLRIAMEEAMLGLDDRVIDLVGTANLTDEWRTDVD